MCVCVFYKPIKSASLEEGSAHLPRFCAGGRGGGPGSDWAGGGGITQSKQETSMVFLA